MNSNNRLMGIHSHGLTALRMRQSMGNFVFDTPTDGTPPANPPGNPAPGTPPVNNAPADLGFSDAQKNAIQEMLNNQAENLKNTFKPADNSAELNKVLAHFGAKSIDDVFKLPKPGKEKPADSGYTEDSVSAMIEAAKSEERKRYDALNGEFTALTNQLVSAEIRNAAKTAKFMEGADETANALLAGQVRFNPEKKAFEVVDASGNARINIGTGKHMTVGELVAELGAKHKYLIEGANREGGGSNSQRTNPAGKPVYTREQLKDGAFYEAHRDDILKAWGEGRIES